MRGWRNWENILFLARGRLASCFSEFLIFLIIINFFFVKNFQFNDRLSNIPLLSISTRGSQYQQHPMVADLIFRWGNSRIETNSGKRLLKFKIFYNNFKILKLNYIIQLLLLKYYLMYQILRCNLLRVLISSEMHTNIKTNPIIFLIMKHSVKNSLPNHCIFMH